MTDADPLALCAKLREALARCPEPPWFAADDRAEDTVPHVNSGLALVDTGRREDWPIARLCEWNTATFIAMCGEDIPVLLDLIERLVKERMPREYFLLLDKFAEERWRCMKCGCLWRLNKAWPEGHPYAGERSWSLFDAEQKPCSICDNSPEFMSVIVPAEFAEARVLTLWNAMKNAAQEGRKL